MSPRWVAEALLGSVGETPVELHDGVRVLMSTGGGRCVTVRDEEGVQALRDRLLGRRRQPVVVLAPAGDGETPLLSPEDVRAVLGHEVEVYTIDDEALLDSLDEVLGARLSLPPGGARIYWPGFSATSRSADHPLVTEVADGPEAELLEELARAFDLSRPRVRAHIAMVEEVRAVLEQRLAEAQELVHEANQRLRDVQIERHREAVRADEAQVRLARSVAERHAGTIEWRLHEAILEQWFCSLEATARRRHPLGRYVLTTELLTGAAELSEEQLARLARACALLACGAPCALRRDMLVCEPAGAGARADGAEGWRCELSGSLALRYWVRADGTIEFAELLAG